MRRISLLLTALVVLGAQPALASAAFTGGPLIGKPKAAVVRLLEDQGWAVNDGKSDHTFAYGDSFYTLENPDLHLDVVIDYNRRGIVTGGELMPYMDDRSEALIDSRLPTIIKWFAGKRRPKVEKKRAGGSWASIKIH